MTVRGSRDGEIRHVPMLMLGVGAYLLALPFLPPQVLSIALFGLAACFVFQKAPGTSDDGYGFLLPVLPFLAALLAGAARSPDRSVASAVLSFQLPGLALLVVMMRRTDCRLHHWMAAWTLFSAALCLSVVVGWTQVRLGARLPALMETPEGTLLYSHDLLLIVPNDICAAASTLR